MTALAGVYVEIGADLKAWDRGKRQVLQEVQAFDRQTKKLQAHTKALGGSFAGLGAQFQDIGVSIAGGMNPAIVALQQGTQIAGQMEMAMRSGASASRVLMSGLASLVSPVSLISVGATALVGIGLQYALSSWGDEAEDTSKVLKNVADRMERIRELGVDLAEFDAEKGFSSGLRTSIVAEQIKAIQAEADSARRALEDVFGNLTSGIRIGSLGRTDLAAVAEELQKVGLSGRWAVDRLQEFASAAASGQMSAEEFATRSGAMFDSIVGSAPEAREAVERLRSSMIEAVTNGIELQGNASIASNQLVEINKNVLVSADIMKSAYSAGAEAADNMARRQNVAKTAAENLARELTALEREWRADFVLSVAVQGDVTTVGQLLSAIGAPTDLVSGAYDAEDAAMKLAGAYQNMASGRSSPSQEALNAQYALQNAGMRKSRSGKRGGGGGKESDYSREIQSVRDMIAALETEAQTFGMTESAAARYRVEQELLAAARGDGTEATAAERAAIADLADQYQAANDNVEALRTAEERRIQTLEEMKGVTAGAMSGFLKDLARGKDLSENMANSMLRVGDALIDIAVRNLVEQAFGGLRGIGGGGGLGGGGGGFFSSLFGGLFGGFFADGGVMSSSGPLPLRRYASGGVANSPQLALYGEGSMNEAFVPLPDGRSIPVTMTGNGAPSGKQVIDVRVHVTTDDDRFRADMISISQEAISDAAGPIIGAAVQRANDSAPGAVADANYKGGGDYRRG